MMKRFLPLIAAALLATVSVIPSTVAQSGRSGINNPATVTYPLPVARGGTGVTTSTGSGANVLGTSPTITTPNIVGTITANNATAGSVGEYIESVVPVGSAVTLSTGTVATVTSITLTAGDWDVSGIMWYAPNAATNIVWTQSASSLINNSQDGTSIDVVTQTFGTSAGLVPATSPSTPIPTRRVNVSSSTPVYLVARSSFSVNSNAAWGTIHARRVR